MTQLIRFRTEDGGEAVVEVTEDGPGIAAVPPEAVTLLNSGHRS
ncbi:hypothetical protein V7793_20460 [Streptomyces sp. KLMMK]